MNTQKIYEIFYDDDEIKGAILIKDLDAWLERQDIDFIYQSELTNGELVAFLGEISEREMSLNLPKHSRRVVFFLVLTRLGIGWVNQSLCREI